MRIRDKKHLHNLCLGLIHSLVILIPFGMALFTGVYAIFNKNAYQSYSGVQNVETNMVDSSTQINQPNKDNLLVFTNDNYNTNISTFRFDFIYVQYEGGNISQTSIDEISTISHMEIYFNGTTRQISYNYNGTNKYLNLSSSSFSIRVHDLTISSGNFNQYKQYIYYYKIDETNYLDNAFEYGFQKTNDSFEQVDYSILDFDALELFDIDYTNNVYLTFLNHYIKYLLNMELVLFIPEILLIFFTLIRRLMLSLVDKTDERSY